MHSNLYKGISPKAQSNHLENCYSLLLQVTEGNGEMFTQHLYFCGYLTTNGWEHLGMPYGTLPLGYFAPSVWWYIEPL